jgi:hypothetical protein
MPSQIKEEEMDLEATQVIGMSQESPIILVDDPEISEINPKPALTRTGAIRRSTGSLTTFDCTPKILRSNRT